MEHKKLHNTPSLDLSSTVSSKLNKSGDTLTGNINCNNTYRLTNVPNPSSSTDVANKTYVDTTTGSISSTVSYNSTCPDASN